MKKETYENLGKEMGKSLNCESILVNCQNESPGLTLLVSFFQARWKWFWKFWIESNTKFGKWMKQK